MFKFQTSEDLENVPGLRSKWFWFDEATSKTGTVSTWFTKKDWETYRSDGSFEEDQFQGQHPFGKNVKYEVHENLAGSEFTSDMYSWPSQTLPLPGPGGSPKGSKIGKIQASDLEKAVILIAKFSVDLTVPDFENHNMDDLRNWLLLNIEVLGDKTDKTPG